MLQWNVAATYSSARGGLIDLNAKQVVYENCHLTFQTTTCEDENLEANIKNKDKTLSNNKKLTTKSN